MSVIEAAPCIDCGTREVKNAACAVHKWKLRFLDEQTLEVPRGSQILSVEEQQGGIVLYAAVTAEAIKETVQVYVYGTGHPMSRKPSRFIGTVKLHEGGLMFHVFVGK